MLIHCVSTAIVLIILLPCEILLMTTAIIVLITVQMNNNARRPINTITTIGEKMFKENALSASITFAEGMNDIKFTIKIGKLETSSCLNLDIPIMDLANEPLKNQPWP